MALRKSPEEKAAQEAAKQLEAQRRGEQQRRQAIEREKQAFFKSPAVVPGWPSKRATTSSSTPST
jgi:hypothetical protein